MPRKARRSTFGSVDQLPSGRFRARYTGADGRLYSARTAANLPLTFDTIGDAEAYLARQRTAIIDGTWVAPDKAAALAARKPQTLAEYAGPWLAERPLAERTREEYARLLRLRILPTFGDLPLGEITPAAVRAWYSAQGSTPTAQAHAYALLRTILATAVSDDEITANPCRIRGAGQTSTAKKTRVATLDELAAIVAALPDRYRMMAQLACWCSLRFGELSALQRDDVDLRNRELRIRRSVVRTKTGMVVKAPKSAAGVRTVSIPHHVLTDLEDHLRRHAQPGKAGLVFPSASGGHMGASALHRVYGPAREAAGRPDLSFHDLRHTGQTYAAMAGANLRELMARAGQSSPSAALRYLHEVEARKHEIADRLADLATSTNVTPITAAPDRVKRKANHRKATP